MRMVVIGGGSLTHMPALLQGLQGAPDLSLRLVDPDLPMAELMGHAARTLLPDAVVTVAADRREALEGADAVVFQAALLGEKAWNADKALLDKAGLADQARDTGGLSGMLYALRTAGLVRAVCADMGALCPDAWLVCASEPLGCAVAAADQMGVRVLGVAAPSPEPLLPAGVEAVAAGLHRFRWLLQAQRNGEDALPGLREAVRQGRWGLLKRRWLDWYDAVAFGPEAEHADWLPGQPDSPRPKAAPLARMEEARTAAIRLWAQAATQGPGAAFAQLTREAPRLPTAAVARALCGDGTASLGQLVLPNPGALLPLSQSLPVLLPGRVDARGATPGATLRLPEGVADLCEEIAQTQQALARAAGGDLAALREAVELDPALAGCDRLFAQSLVERMLQANAPLLPAFAES